MKYNDVHAIKSNGKELAIFTPNSVKEHNILCYNFTPIKTSIFFNNDSISFSYSDKDINYYPTTIEHLFNDNSMNKLQNCNLLYKSKNYKAIKNYTYDNLELYTKEEVNLLGFQLNESFIFSEKYFAKFLNIPENDSLINLYSPNASNIKSIWCNDYSWFNCFDEFHVGFLNKIIDTGEENIFMHFAPFKILSLQLQTKEIVVLTENFIDYLINEFNYLSNTNRDYFDWIKINNDIYFIGKTFFIRFNTDLSQQEVIFVNNKIQSINKAIYHKNNIFFYCCLFGEKPYPKHLFKYNVLTNEFKNLYSLDDGYFVDQPEIFLNRFAALDNKTTVHIGDWIIDN